MLIILLCTLTVLCPLIWKINGDSLFLGSALTRWDMLLNGEPPSLLKVKSYWRRHYRWNLCQCETDFSVCNLNLVLKLGLPCLLIFIKTSYTSGIIIYLVFFFWALWMDKTVCLTDGGAMKQSLPPNNFLSIVYN